MHHLHAAQRRHGRGSSRRRVPGNVLLGWNFGDAHYDERLVEAVQERCNYEPGDLRVVFTESQPMFSKKVRYRVIDAALGVVEKGWYYNDDAYHQPFLPDGLVPHRDVATSTRQVTPTLAMVEETPGEESRSRTPDAMSTAIVVGGGPNGRHGCASLVQERRHRARSFRHGWRRGRVRSILRLGLCMTIARRRIDGARLPLLSGTGSSRT